MVTEITNGVKVSVETLYRGDQSNPELFHHVFSYQVRIENRSDQTVQLLRRHWFIYDSNLTIREIEGEGVVGEQPVLEPGQSHTYTSGCNFHTDMGKMHGTYQMMRLTDDTLFDVIIPEFVMIVPYRLN